jgi:hypothetical protein
MPTEKFFKQKCEDIFHFSQSLKSFIMSDTCSVKGRRHEPVPYTSFQKRTLTQNLVAQFLQFTL